MTFLPNKFVEFEIVPEDFNATGAEILKEETVRVIRKAIQRHFDDEDLHVSPGTLHLPRGAIGIVMIGYNGISYTYSIGANGYIIMQEGFKNKDQPRYILMSAFY